jgi:hypothetical protein
MEQPADDEFLKGFQHFRAARRLETRATQEDYETAVVLFGLAHDFRERFYALLRGNRCGMDEGTALGAAPPREIRTR